MFEVGSTIAGATVDLYVGDTLMGSAVATGENTLVSTDGMDGVHAVTAR